MSTGTFKFSLDTSVWNNTIPIINNNSSFTTLTTTTEVDPNDANRTIVSVQYEYTTLNGSDGLKI
jgi:hypothetical protein